MREFFFWAFILVALPGCGELFVVADAPPEPAATTADPGFNLILGRLDRTAMVMCDIERQGGRRCATADEKARGIALSEAAVALNEGRRADFALDYSAAAKAACNGEPQVVEFQNIFPDGTQVCVNCGDVMGLGKPYGDANALCRAKCQDFVGTTDATGSFKPEKPPSAATLAFCGSFAKASTNALGRGCFANECEGVGNIKVGFFDPRRRPEAVAWMNLVGLSAGGAELNDLTRTAASTGEWDAGAVSAQWIRSGDGFVEFGVARNHQVGLTEVPENCAPPCDDTNPGISGIGFALDVGADGRVYIFEKGAKVQGDPAQNGSFGTANIGERFRIYVKSNHDGTATIKYQKVEGTCIAGAPCNLTTLHTSPAVPKFPFRVDVSIQDKDTTISNARMVYIQ